MSSTIQIRVDDELKMKSDQLFKDLGTDTTTAIRMFLTQAVANNGFPFEIKRIVRSPYSPMTEEEILEKLEKSSFKMRAAQILAHEGSGILPVVDKNGARGPAAERLDAELARSGEQVEYVARDVELDDVEQGFLHAVRRWAREHALRRFQLCAARRSGDNSHGCVCSCP